MSGNNEELEYLRSEVSRLRQEVARLTPSLAMLLKTRGYKILQKKARELPLLPEEKNREQYYELLKSYSFRLFLRDVIKYRDGFSIGDVTRYATPEVTKSYTETLLKMRMAVPVDGLYRLKQRSVKSFGPTLEWFVAELLKREYRTEAVWGTSFKRPKIGGDYDVLAKLAWRIIYVEVKSSPPKQVYQGEISAFFNRVEDLAPEIAVFFMDTELRMKDKIVPMFEEEMGARGIGQKIIRIHKELFHMENRIFIMNSKESIEGNFARIIRWYFLYNNK